MGRTSVIGRRWPGDYLPDDAYLGPWHDRDPDEPPELDDDDFCRSMFDPNEGWLES